MPDITPNLGLKKPLGNETVSRATYNENLDILDQNAVKRDSIIAELTGGLLADRPEPGVAGRYYFAQDVGAIYLDTGTEWVLAAASQGDITGLQQQLETHLSDIATQTEYGHIRLSDVEGVIDNKIRIVDNMVELKGCSKTTVFNQDGSISESIIKTVGGANVVERETVFNPDGSITVTTTVYDDDGVTVLKQAEVTTEFNSDGSITEVIV